MVKGRAPRWTPIRSSKLECSFVSAMLATRWPVAHVIVSAIVLFLYGWGHKFYAADILIWLNQPAAERMNAPYEN